MAAQGKKAGDDPKKEEANDDDDGIKKSCADCKTTKTPLWRGGPSGPKSLCNACGIRYRKKRVPSTAGGGGRAYASTPSSDGKRVRSAEMGKKALSESMKMSLAILGKDFMFQTSQVVKKQRCQRKRKLREEELAAVSLIAMSCGSVLA